MLKKKISMDLTCTCPACTHSESLKGDFNTTYRYMPGSGQKVFHLLLHLSLPVIGSLLIGASWWALIPIGGFLVTYIVNSLLFCPGCSYHHEKAGFCGCFFRSVLPYKKTKSWGYAENILGWRLLIGLMLGPTLVTLYLHGDFKTMLFFLVYFMMGIVVHGTVSCPGCRQRGVCYLGRTVLFFKTRAIANH